MLWEFICEGGPHIRHHGSFALKGMNRGFLSRPHEGVISHTNELYLVSLLQGTEIITFCYYLTSQKLLEVSSWLLVSSKIPDMIPDMSLWSQAVMLDSKVMFLTHCEKREVQKSSIKQNWS